METNQLLFLGSGFKEISTRVLTLKLGISALPIMLKRIPMQKKKKMEAKKLAEIGLSIPISCPLMYKNTMQTTDNIKLITPSIVENFCKMLFSFFMINYHLKFKARD